MSGRVLRSASALAIVALGLVRRPPFEIPQWAFRDDRDDRRRSGDDAVSDVLQAFAHGILA